MFSIEAQVGMGQVYCESSNALILYSCKSGTTYIQKGGLGVGYRTDQHPDPNSMDIYWIVRNPVHRIVSAYQHRMLRIYFRPNYQVWEAGNCVLEQTIIETWRHSNPQAQDYALPPDQHDHDPVELFFDWYHTVRPWTVRYPILDCHTRSQCAAQNGLVFDPDRATLWPTEHAQDLYPQLNPQFPVTQSKHKGGWHFSISRKSFYSAIHDTVVEDYAEDAELWNRCVVEHAQRYPHLEQV